MYTRDFKDLIGGGLLVLIGLFVGINAIVNYDLGTLRHLGPGMFPLWVGFLLAGIGAVILVLGLFREGERIELHFRQFVAVVAGVAIFAATVGYFGMVPAVVLLTIAAALADDKLNLRDTAILSVGLAIIALLVFRFALGIPLEAFRWPF
jgi:hypothetical protein